MSKTIDRIIALIKQIPEHKHPDLLDMVENFQESNGVKTDPAESGTTRSKWEHFAGILSDEDSQAMKRVIEEECERMDNE